MELTEEEIKKIAKERHVVGADNIEVSVLMEFYQAIAKAAVEAYRRSLMTDEGLEKAPQLSADEIKFVERNCSYPVFRSGQEPDGEVAFWSINPSMWPERLLNAQIDKAHEHYAAACTARIEQAKDEQYKTFMLAQRVTVERCVADARREVLDKVEAELANLYEQFDEKGHRTEDDNKAVERIYTIGSTRWQHFRAALEE
jgi:hypothetical protein